MAEEEVKIELTDRGRALESQMSYRPKMDTYRVGNQASVKRPTVHALRHGQRWRGLTEIFVDATGEAGDDAVVEIADGKHGAAAKAVKFGMWDGVFARCLLNIFGVIMYLRLGWLVGYAGVGLSFSIILTSVIITLVTTLSLSAICTNGQVAGGGAYFFISRSLGPAFGASIGATFFVANAVAVALYLIGFAETVVGLVDDEILIKSWDQRFIAGAALVLLVVLCFIGVNWVIKVQLGLLAVLVLSIIAFFIGCLMDPSSSDDHKAFVGFKFGRNFDPQFEPDDPASAAEASSEDGTVTWGVAFAVFFPAVTGIMAGANISGDLRDPSRAIPKGTLLAVGVSTVVYLLLAFFIGAVCLRGIQLDNGEWTGLVHDSLLMAKVSVWPPIVYLGIFAATLSSALASLVGAPRILQALARDNLFPYISYFGKGYGASNEPYRGYSLTSVIATLCLLPGDLNAIAPLISNFFLLSYALTNLACFVASLSKSPGWRPTFRHYNKWVSLVGAVVSTGLMLWLDLMMGFLTLLIATLCFFYVDRNVPYKSWGSASEGFLYVHSLDIIETISRHETHVKNWRPQFLVLSGLPEERPHLVKLAYTLRKGRGLTMFGNVILGSLAEHAEERRRLNESGDYYLRARRLHAFMRTVTAGSLREGVRSLLQASGIGIMTPNTVLLGWMKSWATADVELVDDYVGTVGDAFDCGCGVVIVRDEQHRLPEFGAEAPQPRKGLARAVSRRRYSDIDEIRVEVANAAEEGSSVTIDVWWLVDDGGLTVLLAHILRLSHRYRHCQLRIMAEPGTGSVEEQHAHLAQVTVDMERMMKQFRISATVVPVEPNIPDEDVDRLYAGLVERGVDIEEGVRTQTRNFIRTGLRIKKYSKHTKFAVVSIPVPRVDVNGRLYMAWLDTLSGQTETPVLLVRGNQQSVLTFDS